MQHIQWNFADCLKVGKRRCPSITGKTGNVSLIIAKIVIYKKRKNKSLKMPFGYDLFNPDTA
jgi:hypothetical protein